MNKTVNEIKTGVIIKEGYLGGFAFDGVNYKGYMRYSDINKLVKAAFKKSYPDIRISCTGSSFSGGQECNGKITATKAEAIRSFEEFKKEVEAYYKEKGYCFQVFHYINSWDCQDLSYDEALKVAYDNYISRLAWGLRCDHLDELDKMILKPRYYKALSYLNDLYDSFNSCDNNSMVDYFDNLFYKGVSLACEE